MRAKIAIATITRVSDEDEDFIKSSLLNLRPLRLPVFVADRSDKPRFKKWLAANGFKVVPNATSLVDQARRAINAAAKAAPTVCYTEPDKAVFFKKHLAKFLSHREPPTILLPSRSVASFRTYSQIQQQVETVVNQLCSNFLQADGDYCYGPIRFPSSLAPLLDDFPPDFAWGWRIFLIRKAFEKNIPINFFPGAFPCPPGQAENSQKEWLHRLRQCSQNLISLLHDLPKNFDYSAATSFSPALTQRPAAQTPVDTAAKQSPGSPSRDS